MIFIVIFSVSGVPVGAGRRAGDLFIVCLSLSGFSLLLKEA